ncbi:MAG: hypothetical protein Crog4KO_36320 [Crocinitomicaceae bacterium]
MIAKTLQKDEDHTRKQLKLFVVVFLVHGAGDNEDKVGTRRNARIIQHHIKRKIKVLTTIKEEAPAWKALLGYLYPSGKLEADSLQVYKRQTATRTVVVQDLMAFWML